MAEEEHPITEPPIRHAPVALAWTAAAGFTGSNNSARSGTHPEGGPVGDASKMCVPASGRIAEYPFPCPLRGYILLAPHIQGYQGEFQFVAVHTKPNAALTRRPRGQYFKIGPPSRETP